MRDLGLAGLQEFSSYFTIKNTKDNFDYPVDKLPLEFREPFITSGYRRPHLSAGECIQSVFKKSKKTINVWSHVITFIALIFRSIIIFREHNSSDDVFFTLCYPWL